MTKEAIDALKNNQCQLDQDGVMVGVSRQAVDEVLLRLSELEAENARLKERLAEMRDANSWMEREVKEHEFRARSQTDIRYAELINQIFSLETQLADARATALEALDKKLLAEIKYQLAEGGSIAILRFARALRAEFGKG